MLQANGRGLTIIFSRTKRTAAKVADELVERGFAAAAIHGDLGQGAREQALRAFRNGKVDILVATDVAARGIDVENVTHVINYQCPEDEKTYLHRIGRTARAGNTGVAVTFVDWDDLHRWALINKTLDLGIPEPAGDLLQLRPPLLRPRHPHRRQGPRCGARSRSWPASTPRRSRTSARRASATASPAPVPVRGRGGRGERGGDRGRARSTERGREDAEPAESSASEEGGEGRPRRSRNRRRTRGAGAAAAGAAAATGGDESNRSTAQAEGSSDAEGGSRPPRRRRRGGSGRGGAGRTESAPATSATE